MTKKLLYQRFLSTDFVFLSFLLLTASLAFAQESILWLVFTNMGLVQISDQAKLKSSHRSILIIGATLAFLSFNFSFGSNLWIGCMNLILAVYFGFFVSSQDSVKEDIMASDKENLRFKAQKDTLPSENLIENKGTDLIGTWSWDLRKKTLKWNEKMIDLFGLSAEQVPKYFTDWEALFTDGEERERFGKKFHDVLIQDSKLQESFLFIAADRQMRYLHFRGQVERDEKGNPLIFKGTVWDNTEEELRFLQLIEAKNELGLILGAHTEQMAEIAQKSALNDDLLKSISELGLIGGWNLDLLTQKVRWSDQVFVIHELPLGEVPPLENLINFYAPEARGVVIKCLKKCEQEGEYFEFELPLITGTGRMIWVKSKGVPVYQEGKIVAITGIFQEVTNEKQIRDNLIRINEELFDNEKLLKEELNASTLELETFSYTVSHDLRSPLRAIDGFAKALKEHYSEALGEDGDKWLDYIMSNIEKMGDLITDILLFSRIGRTTPQPIELNMNKLIEEKFDELKGVYRNKIIKLNVEKLPKVNGDKMLISQVWYCLLSNALKFSSLESEIRIEVTGKIENDYAIYSITDNGSGFDEKYKQKLFVVFQRLHGSHEFPGSGVGLAIADRIIKKHSGWIYATSKEGVGSTFTFGLPLL